MKQGYWTIMVQGVGPYGNGNADVDPDLVARLVVDELQRQGHEIKAAEFSLVGGHEVEDLLTASALAPDLLLTREAATGDGKLPGRRGGGTRRGAGAGTPKGTKTGDGTPGSGEPAATVAPGLGVVPAGTVTLPEGLTATDGVTPPGGDADKPAGGGEGANSASNTPAEGEGGKPAEGNPQETV